jgi:ATP-dependent exoDNAse (exonuclease V) beta subunit
MLQQLSPAQWTVFSEHGATRLRYLISVFQYWLAQRRRIALSQWIRGVWLAIGGPACYGKDYPMAMAERYFAQLAQMSEGGDILDFAQFKQALAELRMESSAQSVDPKMSPNAVPIEVLTIHKAKGLEFDAVFIPSLEKKARHFDKELLLWTECPTLEGMALLLAPCKANDQRGDPLYQYVQRQLQLKAQLEAVRLLYVAITRAKTEVYLSAVLSTDEREQAWQAPPKNSFLQLLWPYVTPNAPTPQSSVAITAPNLGVIWKKLTDAWQPPAALQAHYAPENPVSPVTQNRPQRATYNKEKIIGILVHRILQQLGLEGFATWQRQALTAYIPSWQTALQRLGLRQVDQANAVAMVMQAIKNTLNSKYGAWLFSTSHQIAHSEWSLAYQLTPQHMAYYVIDRSFIDAKGIRWIVDYKVIELQNTQQLDHEIAHYRPQLQKYCRALQALESRPVKCGLYFPLTDTWWQLNPEGA